MKKIIVTLLSILYIPLQGMDPAKLTNLEQRKVQALIEFQTRKNALLGNGHTNNDKLSKKEQKTFSITGIHAPTMEEITKYVVDLQEENKKKDLEIIKYKDQLVEKDLDFTEVNLGFLELSGDDAKKTIPVPKKLTDLLAKKRSTKKDCKKISKRNK